MGDGTRPLIGVAERAGLGLDGRERPSEDRVVLLPNAVLLADGATALHGEARTGGWYAEQLTRTLARLLYDEPTGDLAELLAAAITELAARFDLVPGQAPSSTVAVLRWTPESVDALVLADSPVVAFTAAGPQVLADDRLTTVPRGGGYRRRLSSGAGYGAEHVAALRASAGEVGRWRNAPGGFWVAEADPAAAAMARRASWPRADVRAALMASDGVSCGVDDYRLFDWSRALEMAERDGPDAVLAAVRAAERADPDGVRWPRPKPHDDQALVLVRF